MNDKKSRNHLLNILNEKEWAKFKKGYKKKGLGNNLHEAIFALIKKENKK